MFQLDSHIYWTDWEQKKVYRADKTSGKEQIVVRPDLDAAMGLTMVSQTKQLGWNPCAINNGGCKYLCFYTNKNYTCGCPDDKPNCKKGIELSNFCKSIDVFEIPYVSFFYIGSLFINVQIGLLSTQT